MATKKKLLQAAAGAAGDAGLNVEEVFSTYLYEGTGSAQTITNGIDLDGEGGLVWAKRRDGTGDHWLVDTERGLDKSLKTNTTDANNTGSQQILSFDSDGFTLAAGQGNSFENDSAGNYVAWNWKAGGTASSNTDGSITSSVSANQDAGISILTYTGNGTSGATIGHGLGKKPSLIIIKNRNDSAQDWPVQHSSIGATGQLVLSSSAGVNYSSVYWNNTEPTSSVFTVGSANNVNKSGNSHVAYVFSEIDGFSKFGKYIGNGSADGAFIYTGFRPAWIMIKGTSAYSWHIIDTKRIGYNDSNRVLLANTTDPEQTNYSVQERDILSNGFKMRDSNAGTNASGSTYIYLAFAENPFKYANAR